MVVLDVGKRRIVFKRNSVVDAVGGVPATLGRVGVGWLAVDGHAVLGAAIAEALDTAGGRLAAGLGTAFAGSQDTGGKSNQRDDGSFHDFGVKKREKL